MSDTTFVAACVQLTSKAEVEPNLATCRRLVTQAAGRGARLVVLPENFAHLGTNEQAKLELAETLDGTGDIEIAVAAMARENGVWIIGGGMPEVSGESGKVYNTLVVFDDKGTLVERYRKVHLFDIDIPDGAQLTESATVSRSQELKLAHTPMGPVGLSICYDLRFPELYRELTARGARMIVVPSAFTLHTGKDHWHSLLRARAIENQVYVLAAAQWGRHNDKRTSYGHSVIIDPWGTIVAEAPDREAVILADIDGAFQDRVRRQLPCLEHRRL